MTKIVAIIGGVLLMAGVATAGTVSSLGSNDDRAIGSTLPTASIAVRQDDRGREAELRGRVNETREDVRREDRRADRGVRIRIADDRGHHQRGHGGDDGGHRGHGGHGGDD